MSLNALRKEEAAPAQETEVVPVVGEKSIDEDAIRAAWLSMAEGYASRARLYTTLTGAALAISEADGVKTLTFSVQNIAQRDWIKEKVLRELESKIISILGCKVFLDVDVIPDEQIKQTSYTSREQAEELMQTNAEVRNLVSDMGLDA